MIKLKHLLDEFNKAQLEKFIKRQDRNKGFNVCDNNLDWTTINWDHVRNHFLGELKEIIEAPHDPKELIDIGNMAFLLWCFEARRF